MWKSFNQGIQAILTWMATPSGECPSMTPSKSLSTGIEKPLEEPKPLQKKPYIEGKFKDILFDKFGLNDRIKIMEPGYFYYAVPNQVIYNFTLRPREVIHLQVQYNAALHQYVDNLNNVQYNNALQNRAQGQWN